MMFGRDGITKNKLMTYIILLTLILAPAYVIRFNLLHLPTDLLMVWIFAVWIIFWAWLVYKNLVKDFIHYKLSIDKKLLIPISLFLLAGFISLFVGGIDRAKLGQFLVWFLQPISLFFISGYIFKQFPKSKNFLLLTLYFLLGIAGIYAIVQYLTLIGLPPTWWGNSVEPKRALSFFVHPNFYALWSAPLLALLIPDVAESLKSEILNQKVLLWIIGSIGLLLSLSRSGWLGLSVAIIAYLIFAADAKIRKIILGAIVAVALIVFAVPNLRWRVILPFRGEKSADSRVELWTDGVTAIKQSPILGLGLTGFAKEYSTINTDPTLDTHNFPHNIFLNFWVETGLLGLISFLCIAYFGIYNGLKNRQDAIKLGIALFLIALISQGLVDNPYFKNDLALVFWMVLSLL